MSTDTRLSRALASSGSHSEESVRPAGPGAAGQAQRADAPSMLKQAAAGRPPQAVAATSNQLRVGLLGQLVPTS